MDLSGPGIDVKLKERKKESTLIFQKEAKNGDKINRELPPPHQKKKKNRQILPNRKREPTNPGRYPEGLKRYPNTPHCAPYPPGRIRQS
jgi:hypothetical protein